MFQVDDSKNIIMHRGDTGEITVTLKGYDFSNVEAVALFSVKKDSIEVKSEIHDIIDNQFLVEFKNADTDYLNPSVYDYDVRVVINPVYSETTEELADGTTVTTKTIVDGDVVRTPEDPLHVTVKRTVGQI